MKPIIHIFDDRWCGGDLEFADDALPPIEQAMAELALRKDCALADSNKEEIKSIEVYQKKRSLIAQLNGPNILLFDLKYDNPALPPLPEFLNLSRRLVPLKRDETKPVNYEPPPKFRTPEEKLHGLYLISEAIENKNWFGHIRIVSGAVAQGENPKIIQHLFGGCGRQDVSFSYCNVDLMSDAIGEIEAAIEEFKKMEGSVHARLLPLTARRWFATTNPSPTFMHHDWSEVPATDQPKALVELTRYFSSLTGGKEDDVRRWLDAHVEANTISALWNNLKSVVGVGSIVHCNDGDRFVWFPALAFILCACSKKDGLAILTGVKFPSGSQIWEGITPDSAHALMNDLIKCFSALANGDGKDGVEENRPLVMQCAAGFAHFTITLDIPFARISAKLQQLEKQNADAIETSRSCGPLLRVQRKLNASPSSCLDVSSSREGKTVLAFKLREEAK